MMLVAFVGFTHATEAFAGEPSPEVKAKFEAALKTAAAKNDVRGVIVARIYLLGGLAEGTMLDDGSVIMAGIPSKDQSMAMTSAQERARAKLAEIRAKPTAQQYIKTLPNGAQVLVTLMGMDASGINVKPAHMPCDQLANGNKVCLGRAYLPTITASK